MVITHHEPHSAEARDSMFCKVLFSSFSLARPPRTETQRDGGDSIPPPSQNNTQCSTNMESVPTNSITDAHTNLSTTAEAPRRMMSLTNSSVSDDGESCVGNVVDSAFSDNTNSNNAIDSSITVNTEVIQQVTSLQDVMRTNCTVGGGGESGVGITGDSATSGISNVINVAETSISITAGAPRRVTSILDVVGTISEVSRCGTTGDSAMVGNSGSSVDGGGTFGNTGGLVGAMVELNNGNGNSGGIGGGGITTGTTTTTIVFTQQDEPNTIEVPILRLSLRPRSHVTWDDAVINNEGLGRKSSKRCCIFHKQRAFGESSTESSEDDNSDNDGGGSTSSSSSSGGGGSGRARRPMVRKKKKRGEVGNKTKIPDYQRFHA